MPDAEPFSASRAADTASPCNIDVKASGWVLAFARGRGPASDAASPQRPKRRTIYYRLMGEIDLVSRFRRSGALLEGHFRLSSGLHSPGYLQCALVLQHPLDAEAIGAELAALVRGLGATAVLSPALGGIVIGQEVARALGIRALFAERQDGTLMLRRGFSLGPDDRVLVVEDVVTTGGSTRETMQVARDAGAVVVGACAIVDRSGGSHSLDVPFHALLRMALRTYHPEACPLCAEGLPMVKPGSRTVQQ
jgi:orotate phosphoribosyltransferase